MGNKDSIKLVPGKLPYVPVTVFRTSDGVQHESEDKAVRHAEEQVVRKLEALMRGAHYFDGNVAEYQVLKFIMDNHDGIAKALLTLQAFEEGVSDQD